ncbi:MAG: low specificity L-threonine aldolase [Chloroflexi bacterium]|nr:low specificity L-threonine aldolase [Chloroflexota bacterium]
MTQRDADAIFNRCTRFVPGHYRTTPQQVLAALAAYTPRDAAFDMYGEGKLIADFETEIAGLLGKPAALFLPSGTMAQQIALRIWADRSGNRNVAFHPTNHLEDHEHQAFRELHHLSGIRVGNPNYLLTLDDLKKVRSPIGTLLLELPQRFIGGMLPTWDELTAIAAWAREQGITLHLDGARLWESQPFYGRSYAEICALFDSVYVSFYKILGGISGATLVGDERLISEAKVWQRRHGGNLPRMYPFVLAAKMGMDQRLSQMDAYYRKACAIAGAISQIEGIEIKPNPPHCNMMQIYFKRDKERLFEAVLDLAEETGTLLAYYLMPSAIPAYCMQELTIGDGALDIPTEDITVLFSEALHRSA